MEVDVCAFMHLRVSYCVCCPLVLCLMSWRCRESRGQCPEMSVGHSSESGGSSLDQVPASHNQ